MMIQVKNREKRVRIREIFLRKFGPVYEKQLFVSRIVLFFGPKSQNIFYRVDREIHTLYIHIIPVSHKNYTWGN